MRSILRCLATVSITWKFLSALNNLPSRVTHGSVLLRLTPHNGGGRETGVPEIGGLTFIPAFDVTKMMEKPSWAAAAIITIASILTHSSVALASTTIPLLSSFELCTTEYSAVERWNSARFLEEQERGRLAKVVFSPDGKTASGTDIEGNKFLASLQPDESMPVAVLAPLVLIGVGALAFSRTSEGLAIQAATGVIGDNYPKKVSLGTVIYSNAASIITKFGLIY